MGSAVTAPEVILKDCFNVLHPIKYKTQEVMKFYETYNGIDTDHSGSIDVSELLKFLNIESSLFTERIFAAFDKDGTGKIDFFEFVVSLWKFCALGKESISKFTGGTKFVWACILTVS
jgi:Ca2+-binding EF-hand superfamily protein